jgi:exodeoxyribonuclease VII small subunit
LAAKEKSFEERLAVLETLVKQMEDGGMELSKTLKSYEEGVKLAKELSRDLDAAEKKMLELKGEKPVPMEDAP